MGQCGKPDGPVTSGPTGFRATIVGTRQPIGMIHALFEVAVKALSAAGGPGDRAALAHAVGTTKTDSIVGPLDWNSGPVKNVTTTPLVGGQWRRGSRYPYDLTV